MSIYYSTSEPERNIIRINLIEDQKEYFCSLRQSEPDWICHGLIKVSPLPGIHRGKHFANEDEAETFFRKIKNSDDDLIKVKKPLLPTLQEAYRDRVKTKYDPENFDLNILERYNKILKEINEKLTTMRNENNEETKDNHNQSL